jgi:hypothetical protein
LEKLRKAMKINGTKQIKETFLMCFIFNEMQGEMISDCALWYL